MTAAAADLDLDEHAALTALANGLEGAHVARAVVRGRNALGHRLRERPEQRRREAVRDGDAVRDRRRMAR
jgi:hypothetical protein